MKQLLRLRPDSASACAEIEDKSRTVPSGPQLWPLQSLVLSAENQINWNPLSEKNGRDVCLQRNSYRLTKNWCKGFAIF